MKNNNKRIFKYIIRNVIEFFISIIISMFIYLIIYNTSYAIYETYKFPFFNSLISLFMEIKNNYFGDTIYTILGILTFIIVYTIVTYKKHRNISLLVDNVEAMSKGNLNRQIEINAKGDIEEVANNINEIVNKLKNITVEERKAQQTKTDLITNVSHDLRTPLTSIIGYLDLIEDGKYKDEVELMYYVNIAYEKSLNLKVLINDLFELTKMQNKTVNFNKMELNLIELLGQLVSQMGVQFKQSNMECRMDYSMDKLMINADPIMLVRAFENLITNAIKYGYDGHYVDIKATKAEDKEEIIIKFINYGEQIPIVDLPHIFDRFYRVDKSRNTSEGSSGLGLAITKNIIEAHDGNIVAISDNNQTVFEVILPYKKEEVNELK